MKKFTTKDCAHLVKQDVLLMAGTKDVYVPLEMLYDQMRVLKQARFITARVFTEEEHVADHCQTSNVKLAIKTMINWMAYI